MLFTDLILSKNQKVLQKAKLYSTPLLEFKTTHFYFSYYALNN